MSDGARDDERRGWAGVIDPRLVARCEQHRRDGEQARVPKLQTWLQPMQLHIEPEAWNTGFLRVREVEIPAQLDADLRERMPQALLRDLHRLVREESWVAREILVGTEDRHGRESLAEARKARQLPGRPPVEPSTRVMRALQTWRASLLAERWQPALADDDPRRNVPT
ncbi:MAG TPA: hypothetical protein VIA18_05555 [Polyangia bacterium]|jgi:hypothetical protein|nr:hypothetical protein [Polyangia bacterium]